jgi:uncharacterized protein DUF3489
MMRRKETTMSTEITTSESQTKRKAKAAKKTKAVKTAKAGKSAKSAKAKPSSKAKGDTKKERVLELLRRKGGATTAEIAKATEWQNHSIRGFISGTLTKKLGLTVESTKNEGGERTYRISE